MKVWLLLGLCAIVAAAPKLANIDVNQIIDDFQVEQINSEVENRDVIINTLIPQLFSDVENRNLVVNALIRQLFAYIRHVINNGSDLLGVGPLDPFKLDEYYLVVPGGLINLELNLKDALVSGLGGFVVHRSNIHFPNLTFDIEISIPKLVIKAEQYDLLGDLFTAIPLYGKGGAEFVVENFRFRALIFLKQSKDGESILIDRVERPSFEIPSFKSNIDGAVGGGPIDDIVNAMVEDVIIGYVNRFQGAIAQLAARAVVTYGNPILDQLDTWKYINPFVRPNY